MSQKNKKTNNAWDWRRTREIPKLSISKIEIKAEISQAIIMVAAFLAWVHSSFMLIYIFFGFPLSFMVFNAFHKEEMNEEKYHKKFLIKFFTYSLIGHILGYLVFKL